MRIENKDKPKISKKMWKKDKVTLRKILKSRGYDESLVGENDLEPRIDIATRLKEVLS